MIGFTDTYAFTQFETTGSYSAIAILHTFKLTVTYSLGSSVFTSRILATDLSPSHCNFKSHVKISWQRLNIFLPLFCSCQFRNYSVVLRLLLRRRSQVKVTLRLTACQSVLVSSPIWCSWPDIYYCWTDAVLLLWGVLSNERTGLYFVRVIVCSSKSFIIM
jgi:hypothetical protein